MTRLPRLLPADLNDEQGALYRSISQGPRSAKPPALVADDGSLLGPFNALLHEPGAGNHVQALGVALRFSALLSGREREIAVLTVATCEESAYELYAHRLIGRNAGLDEQELEALARGEAAASFTATEKAVHETVATLLEVGDLADAQYMDAQATLGIERLVLLTTLVGYYRMLALQLRVFRVLPEE